MLNLSLFTAKNLIFFPHLSRNAQILRSFTQNAGKHYDIIVAGGGMVGTTLACTLGKNPKLSNKKILLLEASKSKPWNSPEEYSNRVVSINPGTQNLLNQIGAWNFIEKNRFATVKRLQVWDALSDTSITFGKPEHTETVSYVVENDLLLAAVGEEAKKCENLQIRFEAKVKDYILPQHNETVCRVSLDNGESFSCDLLLGCDGVKSSVRKSMEADYISWNYNQMGIVATLKLCEKIQNEIAWQRFLPNGPVALLPLTEQLSSLVWSTTPQEAKKLLSLPEDEFVDELNNAIWGTFSRPSLVAGATSAFDALLSAFNCSSDKTRQCPPKIQAIQVRSRAAFPLGFGHSSQYIRKGVALVGDAAHRIHPLAGQGVNLGFGDIACLNQVLSDAVYSGSTVNDLNYLKTYESQRQKHNVPTMLAVEGLHRLYNTDFIPVVLLRSLGLQATHALESLKRAIITQAAS
ncbi:ubiquinone biosynthesis monooxygenase COQ6, mitochondrial-like [Euwallacea similis]|uniref:ubiquinone biosynthesis monooxygenase COQ6, mitochondrial-like n=1 Tax=Euwallacea similis TaxID=1736056 RepID=UPI00344D6DF9